MFETLEATRQWNYIFEILRKKETVNLEFYIQEIMNIENETNNRFNTVPIKIPIVFFFRNERVHFQIPMEFQGFLNRQNNLENEVQSYDSLFNFKT